MQTVKMVITGPFSSGKTEFIRSISEIEVVSTEREITTEAEKRQKDATTVAMDFGRITVDDDLVLYLFGTPGQDRFWFLWDELALGALGAVVMADTRRLADCFPSVDYFERRGTPFIVAVNCFNGEKRHSAPAVRDALDLDPDVPVIFCDARERGSGKDVFVSLIEHVRTLRRSRADAAAGSTI